MTELERLQAALCAVHNHLHAGDVNLAHEVCEQAIAGATVSQPNLSVEQSSDVHQFSAEFIALGKRWGMSVAFVAFLPSASKPGYTSVQIGGEVRACKMLEEMFNTPSIFQGEH